MGVSALRERESLTISLLTLRPAIERPDLRERKVGNVLADIREVGVARVLSHNTKFPHQLQFNEAKETQTYDGGSVGAFFGGNFFVVPDDYDTILIRRGKGQNSDP